MYEFVHTSATRTTTRIRELDINGKDLELPLYLVLPDGIGKREKVTSGKLRADLVAENRAGIFRFALSRKSYFPGDTRLIAGSN